MYFHVQDNTTLKIHEINTERLQKNLQAAKEEHAMLLESKAQVRSVCLVWRGKFIFFQALPSLHNWNKITVMQDVLLHIYPSPLQLVQEAEGWGERLGELEEEMKMCERSHSGMLEDCTNKDERIKVKTH